MPSFPLRTQLNDKGRLHRCWKSIFWNKSVSKKAKSRGIDKETIADFYADEEKNLDEIFAALKKNKHKLSPLFGFPVKKENKAEYRLITAATVRDRIVHKAILSVINNPLFKYLDTKVSYCGVKENIFKNRKNPNTLNTKCAILKLIEHVEKGNYWFFKSDIKGFYDNVPKRKLFNIIKKLSANVLHDHSLNPFIKDVIFFKLGNKEQIENEKKASLPHKYYGISQGSSLSQFLANIYLADFDRYMVKKYGDRFIRYIDDFIVVCKTKEEATEAHSRSERYLKRKGLQLSASSDKTKKVDIRQSRFNFLGLNFSKDQIRWKRSNDEARRWIREVLDLNNKELYGDCPSLPAKFKRMNYKIQGLGDYLRYYHTRENFEEINKQIRAKIKQNNLYKSVKMLDYSILCPIIKSKKWQFFFK